MILRFNFGVTRKDTWLRLYYTVLPFRLAKRLFSLRGFEPAAFLYDLHLSHFILHFKVKRVKKGLRVSATESF